MATLTLSLSGLNCDHCVRSATEAIESVSGVTKANVSLADAKAEIEHENASVEAILAALKEEDFVGTVV